MRTYRAVIFDFDGTLAKTMEDNFRAWAAATSEYGLAIQPEDYYPLEGVQVEEVVRRLFGKYGRPAPDEKDVVGRKERHYLQHHHFELYPGVEELLDRLRRKKVPMAVVTAGLLNRLNRSAPAALLSGFNALVTGEETAEGKPSAAPYLKGAEKLGVEPEACVVIENAPLGIESAKRAGAYCIALCTTLGRDHLGMADEIVESFEGLKESAVIQGLLQGEAPP